LQVNVKLWVNIGYSAEPVSFCQVHSLYLQQLVPFHWEGMFPGAQATRGWRSVKTLGLEGSSLDCLFQEPT